MEIDQVGLEEIKEDLFQRLQMIFHAKRNIAELLSAKLDHGLRNWITSGRSRSCITVEEVYMVLVMEEDMISYNHDLISTEPLL